MLFYINFGIPPTALSPPTPTPKNKKKETSTKQKNKAKQTYDSWKGETVFSRKMFTHTSGIGG